ncbi:MAG: SDR family NAD(P)-dependent oxidoreductase [Calditrichia bacterium]|nr:SDR family NAD(P)-dependent oxidoreductase [Calditrichota bacterium]MCB0285968.1 SDR family NAD(P)-dependent oxidoreductase [Calditrichota bacterium]MCB9066843.1 SDR family NAD(P)-dependent oxidoreductase [Calditrichia bacterium]
MAAPKAIIIGASTGIGEALAIELANNGYEIGLTSRREHLLSELAEKLPTKSYFRAMDVAKHDEAIRILNDLFAEMGDVDLVVINAGISLKSHADWQSEKAVIDVNVTGFVAMFNASWAYFLQRGSGHIAGISSIASYKGFHRNSVYCASKAFISNYMQGFRQKAHRKKVNITVSDIRPGFVATPMTEHNKGMFWVAPPEKAAKQIYSALRRKRSHAFITKRWRFAAWFIQLIPDWIFVRLPA